MKLVILLALCGACALNAQRTTDWWTFGGDAQRDNFGKNEQSFTKDDVKDFRLLWERKLTDANRHESLFPPVVLGRLIGYRGFKELAFIAGSDNHLWAIDADLDRMYWSKHFDGDSKGGKSKACAGNLTAVPVLPGPVVFRARTNETPAQKKSRSAASRFGRAEPIYVLTGDGILRQVNQADGEDLNPPVPFLHSGAMAEALTISEDTVFTATQSGCGEDAAVWSIDTSETAPQPKSFKLGADIAGMAGLAMGSDGKVFVQTRDGSFDPNAGKFGGSLVALNPDLTLSDYFVMPASESKPAHASQLNQTGPLLFTYKGQEMVVAANQDGRLYLLKSSGIGSDDHHHYLSRSMVIPQLTGNSAHGIWGGLSSFEDTDGSRYVLAPVWGPLSEELRKAIPGADAPNGSIVAFKLSADADAPTLTPAWVSHDLESPVPPIVAKGAVFALANGTYSADKMRSGKGSHAVLYVLDAATGQEMFSTKDQVKSAGSLTGLTVVNGRAYFTTVDNTVHVFGKYLEP